MDIAYIDRFVWTHKTQEKMGKKVSQSYCSKVIGQSIMSIVISPPSGQSVSEKWVRFPAYLPALGTVAVTIFEIQNFLKHKNDNNSNKYNMVAAVFLIGCLTMQ